MMLLLLLFIIIIIYIIIIIIKMPIPLLKKEKKTRTEWLLRVIVIIREKDYYQSTGQKHRWVSKHIDEFPKPMFGQSIRKLLQHY